MPECWYNELHAGSLIQVLKQQSALCFAKRDIAIWSGLISLFSIENPPERLEFQTCLFRDSVFPPYMKTMASGLFRCCLNTHTVNVYVCVQFICPGENVQVSVLVIPGEKKPKYKTHDSWIMWATGSRRALTKQQLF